MAAALKLAKRVQPNSIQEVGKDREIDLLIQEAGREQAHVTAHTARYNEVRKELRSLLDTPEQGSFIERTSGGITAKLFFPKHIRVKPKELFKRDPDLFWRVVGISTKDIKDVLDRDTFYKVTEEEVAILPQLEIGKAKKE